MSPAVLVVALVTQTQTANRIDFTGQIRPLLAKNCLACHGPDEKHRKKGLRLDRREGAFAEREGTRAIVPGHPEQSEAYLRITSADKDERMPPADSGKQLSPREIQLVKAWITEGARWEDHWSFAPLVRPAVPPAVDASLARNEIDHFVQARLAGAGLRPSRQAEPHQLARRVAIDLTGLPPAPDEIESFVREPSDRSYEALVDHFLASPAYGERWARVWLDLARYADTKGYEKDRTRTIWRYRDWVIGALNRDMPFSQFTVEQLAGDLLPHATPDQVLATAFHRNTLTNEEGGTDDEEFRVAAVKDRVDTTLQVWMGLTAGCAKCHDHKYDPISQKDYYRLYAFFNQTEDNDREDPLVPTPTGEQAAAQEQLQARLSALEVRLGQAAARVRSDLKDREARWLREWGRGLQGADVDKRLAAAKLGPWHAVGPFLVEAGVKALAAVREPELGPVDFKAAFDGGRLKWTERKEGGEDGRLQTVGTPSGSVTYLARTIHVACARDLTIQLVRDEGLAAWLDGRPIIHGDRSAERRLPLALGDHTLLVKIGNDGYRAVAEQQLLFKVQHEEVGGRTLEVARALLVSPRKRSPAQAGLVRDAFLRERSDGAHLLAERDGVRVEEQKLADRIPRTPVMRELAADKRRTTQIQIRGNFLDKGDKIEAGSPEAFHAFPAGAPGNRLGVARWLIDDKNPLTARVAVNRHWAQLFGVGLVETEEDFGTQGTPPVHRELLDWLATEFVSQGWSMKRLAKTIVMSATYRQNAGVTPELASRDRFNRLLARGPRFRLEAEMVRDGALAVAGLLSHRMYGPSVMPPQPDGIWGSVYSSDKWITSAGEDRWRRGLYTFVKRTSPYPSMITFDAPSREYCSLRRIRSNTPLQALVTLNDPVYVEAGQALARRMIKEAVGGPRERIAHGFHLALSRPARPAELDELLRLYSRRAARYRANGDEARAMATDPLGALPAGMDLVEAAALSAVSNVILNLDEFLTKG